MNAKRPVSLSTIRAISFDLDDTFWDCAPAISRAEDELYAWLDKHFPDVTEKVSRETMVELRAQMYQSHPHLAIDVTMMRKAFLESLLQGHDNCAQHVEDAFAVFYKARSEVVLYDGVIELLGALKPNYKLAAITNGNADLDLIGIARYFDDIQCAGLDNLPKPASNMFDSCCANLGVNASELLHVGDNTHADVVGGYLAGASTVWFNQTGSSWPNKEQDHEMAGHAFHGPDYEVSSIAELQKIFKLSV